MERDGEPVVDDGDAQRVGGDVRLQLPLDELEGPSHPLLRGRRRLSRPPGPLGPGLEVRAEALQVVHRLAERRFERPRPAVGLDQAERLRRFQVEVDRVPLSDFVNPDVVGGEALPSRQHADQVEDPLLLSGDRLDVHDDVGARQDGPDRVLRRCRNVVRPFETGAAVDGHRQLHEGGGPRVAHPHPEHLADSRHEGGGGDLFAQRRVDAIEQLVDVPAAQVPADLHDDAGHEQGRDRVGPLQPGEPERFRQAHEDEAEEDDAGGPEVGREVDRVGLQRRAGVLAGDAQERAGTGPVDHEGERHHQEGPVIGVDRVVLHEEPLHRLDDDPEAGQQQEEGLHQGGEVLDLAVAVLVLRVRRAAGDADRQKREARGQQIESGVQRLGEDPQGVGSEPDHELGCGQRERRQDGAQRDLPLLAVGRRQRMPLTAGLSGFGSVHPSRLRLCPRPTGPPRRRGPQHKLRFRTGQRAEMVHLWKVCTAGRAGPPAASRRRQATLAWRRPAGEHRTAAKESP